MYALALVIDFYHDAIMSMIPLRMYALALGTDAAFVVRESNHAIMMQP
jgi:hypothetical protein